MRISDWSSDVCSSDLQGRRVEPEAHPERGGYYRSDHFSFAKLGVPMLDAGSGEDLVSGGTAAGEAAAKDYGEHRYHQPADEYDPTWDWSGAIEIGRAHV